MRNEESVTSIYQYGAEYTRTYTVDGVEQTEHLFVGPWTENYSRNWVKRTNKNQPGANARLVKRTKTTIHTEWRRQ
jgi:hypothetical protein